MPAISFDGYIYFSVVDSSKFIGKVIYIWGEKINLLCKEEEKSFFKEEFKEAASICKERNPFMHLYSLLQTAQKTIKLIKKGIQLFS